MRAKLLGAALAALIAPVAMAADIDRAGKVAAPVAAIAEDAPAWNRGGAYVGLVGAYDVALLDVEGIDLGSGKLMAGAFVGYNWRVASNIVLGIEGDWIFTGVSASTTTEEIVIKATTDHLVTLRLRAGMTAGPALLYLTAGPAWQQTKLAIGDVSDRQWQLGAAFGGGAELELTRSLFVRLEALHYIFPNDGAPFSEFLDSDNQHTAVRVGLGFKLN